MKEICTAWNDGIITSSMKENFQRVVFSWDEEHAELYGATLEMKDDSLVSELDEDEAWALYEELRDSSNYNWLID